MPQERIVQLFLHLHPDPRNWCYALLSVHVAVVEDQDEGKSLLAASICHPGLDASRVDYPLGRVGDLVEEIPMLCVETLIGARLAVHFDFLKTVCGFVAPY